MKNLRLPWLFFLAILIVACSDNDYFRDQCNSTNSIIGHWEWVESNGGFGGWTLTPTSTGDTKRLEIDDLYYTEFLNDSIVRHGQYDLFITQDTILGTSTYLELESGWLVACSLVNNEFAIIELCFDCYVHNYIRQ